MKYTYISPHLMLHYHVSLKAAISDTETRHSDFEEAALRALCVHQHRSQQTDTMQQITEWDGDQVKYRKRESYIMKQIGTEGYPWCGIVPELLLFTAGQSHMVSLQGTDKNLG